MTLSSDELKKRTKGFAHRCIKLATSLPNTSLPNTSLGRHISKQLIRCSTSVAANYRAVCVAQSKASFIAKLSIVIEEADESAFWMEFLVDEQLKKRAVVEPLLNEANELLAFFIASRKTARNRTS